MGVSIGMLQWPDGARTLPKYLIIYVLNELKIIPLVSLQIFRPTRPMLDIIKMGEAMFYLCFKHNDLKL